MGGDNAPDMIVAGASLARERYPQTRYIILGDQARLKPLLERHKGLAASAEIRHTDEQVSNEDKPSVALRKRRNSSMWRAIDLVAKGEAQPVAA